MNKISTGSYLEDLLTTNDSQKQSTYLFTQRLQIKKQKLATLPTFETLESLKLYYKKLKNINHKKELKILQLQEEIRLINSIPSENSRTKRMLIHNDKEKLQNTISSCEKNADHELEMNFQLQSMRQRELLQLEKLQENNTKSRDFYLQVCAEYEKLRNMTSNANNLGYSAQGALDDYEKFKQQESKSMKKRIKQKKNEVFELCETIKSIRAKSEERIRKYDEKNKKNAELRDELIRKVEETEKMPNRCIREVLNLYKSQFKVIFEKLGLKDMITNENIECVIKAMNMYNFRDGSLSERYFFLSQCHLRKIEEFNMTIKELSSITDIEKKENLGSTLPLTFNMQRTQDYPDKSDELIEKLLLKAYTETYAMGHRIIKFIINIKNISSLSSRIYPNYKKLKNLIFNENKKGRKTLLKAITQTTQAPEPLESLTKSKLNIYQEYLKHYPNDISNALFIQNIIKSSPILSFIINSKIFENFLIFSNPLQEIPLLIKDSYQIFSEQYANIIKALNDILEDARNSQVDDPACNENVEFTRRKGVQVRNSIIFSGPGLNSSIATKKVKKITRDTQGELASLRNVREKIDSLKRYHFRATKSESSFKNPLRLNCSQKLLIPLSKK
ncbi:hypothetical protein SteCoe_17211 [Stentor coeruleus]|uniref:Uncharacterized protein n=1 Tax=Stentor coeruleus TaxID=5963 RepID=A0A1R2BZI2_9CILI|nr:hypothetical protein SteCoe_17211 [Stentor coeruleus]